jgi:hypothetical protein
MNNDIKNLIKSIKSSRRLFKYWMDSQKDNKRIIELHNIIQNELKSRN